MGTGQAWKYDGQDDAKEFVPEWDGKREPLNTYLRRVEIFVSASKTHPSRRGIKLLQRLKNDAFEKCNSLDPSSLMTMDGVDVFLKHLKSKYEPFEAVKIGKLGDEFRALARHNCEDISDLDTRFESKLKEVETVMGKTNEYQLANDFLRALRLPGPVQSEVITGAGNRYNYDALRNIALACIPHISMLRSYRPDHA